MAAKDSPVRKGAHRVQIFNSGLEVWLYDERNADAIRKKGLWQKLVDGGKTDGLLVGYGLWQDDSLLIDVVVGPPLTERELSTSRWLEPQHAFLRAPSGTVAVESNDSCRVSPESDDDTDAGALISVPPGDYRVTLYRTDYETLKRERRERPGAQEVIVLTPGGKRKDDAKGLLPFRQSADASWAGRVTIEGKKARGLVWFDDHWDTYFGNLDSAAATKLGLKPGVYFRTTVPATGHDIVTVFAENWVEGAKLKRPAGPKLPEFAYGAIVNPQRWQPHEALFCRRVTTTKVVDDPHKTVWHEATFEVLDLQPEIPVARDVKNAIFRGATRAYGPATLAERPYFDEDAVTLPMKLDGRVKGVAFDDEISLPAAVEKLDAAMKPLGLKPLGDFTYEAGLGDDAVEYTVRAWTGRDDAFAVVSASAQSSFDVYFCSRLASGKWLMTGTLDESDAATMSSMCPRLLVGAREEVPLAELFALHQERLASSGEKADSVPGSLPDLVKAYDDILTAAAG